MKPSHRIRKIMLIAGMAGLLPAMALAYPFLEKNPVRELQKAYQRLESQELFGESFATAGQLEIYKLFLAMLDPVQNVRGGHDVMLLTRSTHGLGDYSYVDKAARHLLKSNPSLNIGVATASHWQARTLKTLFCDPPYSRYWFSGGEPGESDTAHAASGSSHFNFMLASKIGYALKPVTENNAFFIGEMINDRDTLTICDNPTCRAEQLRWSYRKYVSDYIDFTLNILNTTFETLEDLWEESIRYMEENPLEEFETASLIHSYAYLDSMNLKDLPGVYFKPSYEFTDFNSRQKAEYCRTETKLIFCYHTPRFGLSPINAGVLVDPDLLEKVTEFREANDKKSVRLFSALDSVPADLKAAISGSENNNEQTGYFLGEGNYYFGYFHDRNGRIGFIRSVAEAHPGDVVRIVLPFGVASVRDDLNRSGLLKGNITQVRHWTSEEGWKTHNLSEETGGSIVEIINIPRVPKDAMQALAFFSRPVVGTTGDQSLFEALTMGKLPFHEVVSHQFFVRHQLELIARHPLIKAFYSSLDPKVLGPLISQLEASPVEIADFTREIVTRRSANGLIQSIVDTALSPSAEVQGFLVAVDALQPLSEDYQDRFLSQLDQDRADIALARFVFNTLRQNPWKNLNHERLGELISNIDSYLIRMLLSEALFEKTAGKWKPGRHRL